MEDLLLFTGGMLSSSDIKDFIDSTKLSSKQVNFINLGGGGHTSQFSLVNLWRGIGLLDRHLPCKAGDCLGVREDGTPEVNLECVITMRNIDTNLAEN